MELIIVFVIAGICFYVGYYFGKKEKVKPLTEDEKRMLQREREEEQWNRLFTYNETIATKGRGDK